jgi:hypothetical protein
VRRRESVISLTHARTRAQHQTKNPLASHLCLPV